MNDKHFPAWILSSVVLLSGCHPAPQTIASPPVVIGLSTAVVQQVSLPDGVRSVGTVRAKEDSVLSVQTTGRVAAVLVREGDAVRAGQTLLTLDNAEALSNVAQAKASVGSYEEQVKGAQADAELANSTLHRYELLKQRKSVSPQEFDEVARRAEASQARVDAAQAQLAAAKAGVAGASTSANYSRLTAPFAGYVTARHVDPGAMALPGSPLLEIERAGPLQLQITVDESLVQEIQNRMPIQVSIGSLPSPSMLGRVAEIDPAADPASHSFVVKIDLPPSAALRSGMFGTAAFSQGTHLVVVLPRSAVVKHGSLDTVWIVGTDGVAALRYVTLGETRNETVEALSGLSAGERVVLAPEDRELGGRRIGVQR